MAFGYGADDIKGGAGSVLRASTDTASTEGFTDTKGRGDAMSLTRDTMATAALERDVAQMGMEYIGAAQERGVVESVHESGRSTMSTADIDARREDIRTMIGGNYVTEEILATLPAELRQAAEPTVEAEMRRMGRNPDETAEQRDVRVAQEQQELQQAVGVAISGTGLLGALESMTGQVSEQKTAAQDNSPFAGLLAGIGGLNLGERSGMKDFGKDTAGFAYAMDAEVDGYGQTVADVRDKSVAQGQYRA